MQLPEKIRWTLNKIVRKMRTEKNVYGIGLFGSWSRGDAVTASDVDLLILDAENFNREYTERNEVNGLLVDFNHVPKKWLTGMLPLELDQKINELQIFYDRDWTLSNTKTWVTKFYDTPERISIRCEAHVVEADIYLSRATSAFARHDYQSAQLYARASLQNILRILLEIAKHPFSNSRFIEKLEKATEKLEMSELFEEYLESTQLREISQKEAEEKLKLFKQVWDEISFEIKKEKAENHQIHFQVQKSIAYYVNPLFLQGMVMRTKNIINQATAPEAAHYMQNTLICILENYAWIKTKTQNTKLDLTTLIRALQSIQQPKTHQKTIQILKLHRTSMEETERNIRKTKRVIKHLRMERRRLIENMETNSPVV